MESVVHVPVYGKEDRDVRRTIIHPSICPICKHAVAPEVFSSSCINSNNGESTIFFTYVCHNCFKPYIAYFPADSSAASLVAPVSPDAKEFDHRISALSPSFVKIYNQALAAESHKLDEICGIGYRRALEFLIKDYLVSLYPDEADSIKNAPLGRCISDRVDCKQLKIVATSAVWIGNDFTHYTRKHESVVIDDLKRYIDSVVQWILLELNTVEAVEFQKSWAVRSGK